MFRQNGHAFQVETLVFEGPLDLLLQLIERAELEITTLSIAQVTHQFLTYLRELKETAAEEVAAFLEIASRLVQIKSEALLPRPPEREYGEEDPAEALARQLLAYRRYKEIAQLLQEREHAGKRTHLRVATAPKFEGRLDLTGIGLNELWAAAVEVFSAAPDSQALNSVVSRPRVSIRTKLRRIVDLIRRFGRTKFSEILAESISRMDAVVSFLAMLELVKRKRVSAVQESLFGDIEIGPAEEWDENAEFELEFGE